MKKLVFVFVGVLFSLISQAQLEKEPKLLKYITTGPDGAVVLTVLDDSRKDKIEVQPAKDVYKYQLKNSTTGEILLTFANNGKLGSIDKKELATGDFTIVVYTKSFIMTSDLKLGTVKREENSIAMSEEN